MLRFGVGPRAIHVLNGLQIEPNHVAGLDELRHPHFDAVGELCRLERAVRLLVRGGSGVRDFRLDGIRKHQVGRPAAYEFQEGGAGTGHRSGDFGLLVVSGIHETTVIAVHVQEFQRLLLDWQILQPQFGRGSYALEMFRYRYSASARAWRRPSGLGPDGIPRRPRVKSDFRKQSPFPRAFEMQAPLSAPLPPKAGKWIAQLQYGRPVKTDTAIRFHSTSASGGFSQFFRNQQRHRTYYS